MNFFQKLINTKINQIGRASDMLWIIFNNLNNDQSYSLHVQCPWRIYDDSLKNVLIASYDIYLPRSLINDNNFLWDEKGNNLFDEKIDILMSHKKNLTVENVEISAVNDLTIFLSNNITIELFNNTSSDEECWRFIDKEEDIHYVAEGINIVVY